MYKEMVPFSKVSEGDVVRMATSAGPGLGRRVTCGAGFKMGMNVEELMSRSSSLGVRKVDFFSEVS